MMLRRNHSIKVNGDQENPGAAKNGKLLGQARPQTRAVLGDVRNVLRNNNAVNDDTKPTATDGKPTSKRPFQIHNGLLKRTRSQVVNKFSKPEAPKETTEDIAGNEDGRPPTDQPLKPLVRGDISKSTTNLHDNKENRDPCAVDESLVEVFPRPQRLRSIVVRDIDHDDFEDPFMGGDVIKDIYDYMMRLEKTQAVRRDYLHGRKVSGKMRGILVDWLVQVHTRFHLTGEVLYMTIALIDRYMCVVDVPKESIQLVGVTAMFIASKYEEIYAPELNDFVYITDNSYTKEQILQTEMDMLRGLNFDLGRPLPLHFLRRCSKAMGADGERHTLAKYLTETMLVDYELVHLDPSRIAAAALYLTTALMPKSSCRWNATMVHYSGYKEEDLCDVTASLARLLIKIHEDKSKLVAVKNRYASTKLFGISGERYIRLDVLKKVLNNKGTATSP